MIKITNLEKFYNKRKNNEIKVINNTSITLPDSGLISLLGESGSGKTTLLNVIGGLDKFDTGEIKYDDISFEKYNMKEIDKYRNNYISYIFQNYYLIDNLSIYDNLKLALEICNIYSKEEQDLRINETLNAVGLYKYRKKRADALSGGQRQRVAIARALIKKNKLIIADEPTGNLDSTNSLNIMKILKEISKTTLVLLVTHNVSLAEYFSDYIYQIKDGKIIDSYEPNGKFIDLDDDTVYLKDLEMNSFEKQNVNIDIYNNTQDLKIDLVFIDGIYYLKCNQKIKMLSESNFKVVNSHKPEKIDISKEKINYNPSKFKDTEDLNFFIKFIQSFKNAVFNFKFTKKRIKFLHLGLFLLGCITAAITISLITTLGIDETKNYNAYNTYTVGDGVVSSFDTDSNTTNEDELIELYDEGKISSLEAFNTIKFSLYTSSIVDFDSFKCKLYSKSFIPDDSIEYLDSIDDLDDSKIIISKGLAEEISNSYNYSESNLIGKNLYIDDSTNLIYSYNINSFYEIVGIIDNDSYTAYINDFTCKITTEDTDDSNLNTYYDYYNSEYFSTTEQSYTLKSGSAPTENNEIMLSSTYSEKYAVGDTVNNFVVTGFAEFSDSSLDFLITPDGVTRYTDLLVLNNHLIENSYSLYSYKISFLVNDSSVLSENDDIILSYKSWEKNQMTDNLDESFEYIIILSVLALIVVIYIYFTERSKLFSDIKKIGTLRAIGMKRKTITSNYAIQSFVEALFTSALGYICISVIVGAVTKYVYSIIGETDYFYTSKWLYLVFIFMLVIFMIFGSIPSIRLMRKTPSEIINKYDI